MRMIELDATKWKTLIDFYGALLPAIGAPDWHGRNPNALVDSMIWGGINTVEPPYTIRISAAASLPEDVRSDIEQVKYALAKQRVDFRRMRGRDVEVTMEIVC